MKLCDYRLASVAIIVVPLIVQAQVTDLTPVLGRILPSGGKRGSTVIVEVSGASIAFAPEVVMSDERIRAEVIHVYERSRFDPPEQGERAAIMNALRLARQGKSIPGDIRELLGDVPLLAPFKVDGKLPSDEDVRRLEYEYFIERQREPPARDVTRVMNVKIDIPASVEPGTCEMRLKNRGGLSRPLYFQISDIPEVLEVEPCTPDEKPVDPPFPIPVCINGCIRAGDVDYYRFNAVKGEVIELHAAARDLKPFIADGVPGWFEAVIVLYDTNGREISYSDCTGFRPDPTIVCEVPETGVYMVEVRDSLYRGRLDFVYRLSIREHLKPAGHRFQHHLDKPGAVNSHPFEAEKGDVMVVSTIARLLGSPVDTYVQVVDDKGNVLAGNDDWIPPFNIGTQTVFADSRLSFTVPENGRYSVRVSDTSQQGGENYGYDLKISKPDPGFDLYVTPANVSALAGSAVPLTFHALRRDGFAGGIDIEIEDAPPGMHLLSAHIPEGQSSVRAVLQIGNSSSDLRFTGKAGSGDNVLSSRVVPADDWEQAFIWHHIVPTGSFRINCLNPKMAGLTPQIELKSIEPVRLKKGGRSVVTFTIPATGGADLLDYTLLYAPEGVRLEDSAVGLDFLELNFTVDRKVSGSGTMIVEMSETRTINRNGKRDIRFSRGVLPPIPYVGQQD